MQVEKTNTIVIGGGQAGIAMSEHLGRRGIDHIVLERHRIAERWRTERWDSLVANGPAWHDRFPGLTFEGVEDDSFASKDRIVEYFEQYARQINAPVRCGIEVLRVEPATPQHGYRIQTSQGLIEATNVVSATGAFQRPVVPDIVPADIGVHQIHSSAYRNPQQLPEGAVLVVGAGSSGAQIADELLRAGRRVYLAIGPHQRPPRRYRGKDFCWWLGALGHWDITTKDPATEHVTISVSGARGGHTVDFREFALRGMTLLGRITDFQQGSLAIAADLSRNLAGGDEHYLSVLDEADRYIEAHGLDFPTEPAARLIGPDPECVSDPLASLKLDEAGISTIVWATGFANDYSWLKADIFDAAGRPIHERGVSPMPGLYFLGLPWLTRRASPFIWGVWHDAENLAEHILANGKAALPDRLIAL